MTRKFRAILLVAVGMASIAAAEPRQPTGRWVVNFDAAQCIASRNYGTADNPLFLALKSPPLGSVVQVGVIRPGQGGATTQLDGEFAIDQRTPLRTSILAFTAKKLKRRAYWINLPIEDFAPVRSARFISIRAKGELDERFETSAIAPLMKIMDECVADLRKVWSVTEGDAIGPNLKQPVSGDLRGVINDWDYPAVAMAEDQSGTVTLALLIDETGRVADCSVIGTSGAASLDAQSCGVLKERARFKPAIGLDGKPAKGSFIQRITWRTS